MVAWGIVMTLMCRVESYGGLIAARLCLGIAEVSFLLSFLRCTEPAADHED
jgi:hypothetical protein